MHDLLSFIVTLPTAPRGHAEHQLNARTMAHGSRQCTAAPPATPSKWAGSSHQRPLGIACVGSGRGPRCSMKRGPHSRDSPQDNGPAFRRTRGQNPEMQPRRGVTGAASSPEDGAARRWGAYYDGVRLWRIQTYSRTWCWSWKTLSGCPSSQTCPVSTSEKRASSIGSPVWGQRSARERLREVLELQLGRGLERPSIGHVCESVWR